VGAQKSDLAPKFLQNGGYLAPNIVFNLNKKNLRRKTQYSNRQKLRENRPLLSHPPATTLLIRFSSVLMLYTHGFTFTHPAKLVDINAETQQLYEHVGNYLLHTFCRLQLHVQLYGVENSRQVSVVHATWNV